MEKEERPKLSEEDELLLRQIVTRRDTFIESWFERVKESAVLAESKGIDWRRIALRHWGDPAGFVREITREVEEVEEEKEPRKWWWEGFLRLLCLSIFGGGLFALTSSFIGCLKIATKGVYEEEVWGAEAVVIGRVTKSFTDKLGRKERLRRGKPVPSIIDEGLKGIKSGFFVGSIPVIARRQIRKGSMVVVEGRKIYGGKAFEEVVGSPFIVVASEVKILKWHQLLRESFTSGWEVVEKHTPSPFRALPEIIFEKLRP